MLSGVTSAMMMSENELLLLDRYEVLGTMRRGPTAVMLLTYDRRLGRRVVVELVALPTNGFTVLRDAADRLMRQTRMAAALSHPNISAIHEVCQSGATMVVVSDFDSGRTLAQRLRDEGPLPLEAALDAVRQVASGLAFAHAHGLLHRGLDPTQVVEGVDGRMKIRNLGRAGAGVAPPRYVAPETILRQPVSEATDVWALGVLLYETLTGRPPFDGESADLCARVVRDVPVRPRRIRPDISPALENVILTCLEKEPGLRYPSVSAFLQSLDNARQKSALRFDLPPVLSKQRPPRRTVLAWMLMLLVLTASAWLLSAVRALQSRRPFPLRATPVAPLERSTGPRAPTD